MKYRFFQARSSIFKVLIPIILILVLIVYSLNNYYFLDIPIYGFHGVFSPKELEKSSYRPYYLDYSINDLRELLTYLVKNDYWFLSTQEFYDYFLVQSHPIPFERKQNKPVMLTFDDGYKNIDLYLLPLLKEISTKYNKSIKVVLFINPKFIQQNNQKQKAKYLQCKDLQKGVEQGFYDVQSHGFSHNDLTKLDSKHLNYELKVSQTSLQSCLAENKTVALHFAYPYDQVNSIVEEQTAKYYLSAFRFNSRFRKILFKKNNYTIPRFGVNQSDTPEILIKAIK